MAPGVRRSEPAGARMVPPREGNEARGDGRRGIGAPHTTGEAGESCPRNPVEGRGRREMDPLAGKTANTPRLEPVSTLRQRIAERARHALGMAWVIFIASWTNGYATARSEAICRGAGCGRTRTSGSVGGQGQQRPWSTRPYKACAVNVSLALAERAIRLQPSPVDDLWKHFCRADQRLRRFCRHDHGLRTHAPVFAPRPADRSRLYFRYWARSGMRYDPNPLDTNVEMSASIRRFRGI